MKTGRVVSSLLRAGLTFACLGLLPACGKRGDPLEPLPRNPQPVADLKLAQRGPGIEVTLVAPRLTTGNVRLPVLEIELLQATGDGDFQALAKRNTRKAAPGEELREIVPLPPPGTQIRVAARAIAEGAPSTVSRTVSMRAQAAPPVPTELIGTLVPGAVTLAWKGVLPPPPPPAPVASPPVVSPAAPAAPARGATPPPGAAAAPTPVAPTPVASAAVPGGASPSPANASPAPSPPPPPQRGFWVYRRSSAETYSAPLMAEPLPANAHVDSAVAEGETWCYVVRMVLSAEPVVESASSNEVCVAVKDVAPPAAPTGVATLPRTDAVEVSWSPSPESDLAGFRVYRTQGGGKPARIGEVKAGETTFRDVAPGRGGVHVYTVTAFDTNGNESAPSLPVEGQLP